MLKHIILLSATFIFFISCTSKKGIGSTDDGSDLEQLQAMMAGKFTSAEQAATDSSYYDISLAMFPIWPGDANTKWLYVEQAVSANLKKPYRQRVYRLTQVGEKEYESKVYALPDPEDYIHAWEDESIFKSLKPEDLIEREGCSIFLKLDDDGIYKGSTKEDACKSSLRGATYATAKVEIGADVVESWDQGWNDKDEQVWGATKAGYVFKRTGSFPAK